MKCTTVPTPGTRLYLRQRSVTALLLNAIMFGGGFVGINSEWWHFELPDAARYPLLDDQIDCYTVTPITTQHPL